MFREKAEAKMSVKGRMVRLVLSAFVVLAATASMSVAAPAVARAAPAACVSGSNSTGYQISRGCYSQRIPGTHVCAPVGPATGANTAVECADLYVTDDATGHGQLWGEGEFYCQPADEQCLGMNVNVVGFYIDLTHGGTGGLAETKYVCNPTVGACPSGGEAAVATGHSATVVQTCLEPIASENAGEVISVPGTTAAYHTTTDNGTSGPPAVCFK
jgi:hypothetical protein